MTCVPIGIDLGTTGSTLAYAVQAGSSRLAIHTIDDGVLARDGKAIPSVVHFRLGGIPVAGVAARDELLRFPQRTVQQVKRRMGDPSFSVQFDAQPPYGPQELSALILGAVRRRAEQEPALRGCPLDRIVLAVPAYFNQNARRASIDAARGAGFTHVQLIDEPTAAAIDYLYGQERPHPPDGTTIAVLDLGGGTLDISIVRLAAGQLEVVAIGGDDRLGGLNFDLCVAREAVARWLPDDPWLAPLLGGLAGDTPNPAAVPDEWRAGFVDLLEQAAAAKRALASMGRVQVGVSFNGRRQWTAITADDLAAATRPLLARLRRTIEDTLGQADDRGIARASYAVALLVGGASLMPAVRASAVEAFAPVAVAFHPQPFLAVARGAARKAASDLGWTATRLPITTVTARDLLVRAPGSVEKDLVIPRGTAVPSSRVWHFTVPPIVELLRPVEVWQGEVGTVRAEQVLTLAPYTPWVEPGATVEVTFRLDENGLLDVAARLESSGGELPTNVESFTLPEEAIIAMRRDYDE